MTTPKTESACYMRQLTAKERIFHHSLSNTALLVTFGLWLLIGWYGYRMHKQAVASRTAQDALVQAVVGSGQVVVVCDEHGIITGCSPSATTLFHTDLVGRQIHSFCPPGVRERADAAFNKALISIRQEQKPAVYTFPHIVAGDVGKAAFEGSITVRVVPESSESLLIVAVFTPATVMKSLPDGTLKH